MAERSIMKNIGTEQFWVRKLLLCITKSQVVLEIFEIDEIYELIFDEIFIIVGVEIVSLWERVDV